MVEILKPNFEFSDGRGKLIQLVRTGFNQVNVIESKAGCIRGSHYHKSNREAFFIINGKLELTLRKDGQEETITFKNGDMFLIPAYTVHDFKFITDTTLVSMYDKGVEMPNGEKDIVKE